MTGEPEIVVASNEDEATAVAAGRIASALAESVAEHGRANWATSGGSAPVGIYRRLVAEPLRSKVSWNGVHIWWGDDRYVPRDHPLSNVKPLDDILLAIGLTEEGQAGRTWAGVPLPVENLHPFPTGEAIGGACGPEWCAATLAHELRTAGLPTTDGWPVFDVILLGIGPDGHLLSVFPGSVAFESRDLALAIPAPTHVQPHVQRVTLNPAVIPVATRAIVVVTGAAKAEVVGRIFGGDRDPKRWPGQLARRQGATWILDPAAAAGLPR